MQVALLKQAPYALIDGTVGDLPLQPKWFAQHLKRFGVHLKSPYK
jgi:hypothetical protein